MSLWDRIDAESKPALDILWEALPGGLNGIPDIVARRAAYETALSPNTATLIHRSLFCWHRRRPPRPVPH